MSVQTRKMQLPLRRRFEIMAMDGALQAHFKGGTTSRYRPRGFGSGSSGSLPSTRSPTGSNATPVAESCLFTRSAGIRAGVPCSGRWSAEVAREPSTPS